MKPAVLTILAALASPALAQSNIDPAHKFAWSENCGWLNFADAGSPTGQQAAFFSVSDGYAHGYVWGENIGWINLGNGAGPYANTDGATFGVNINAATGHLSGMAWGENVGWINFSGGALATPPNPARLDLAAGRLRGYAWGENIGWINLDDATHYIGVLPPTCDPDYNQDGNADQDDIAYLVNVIAGAPNPSGRDPDFNADGNADQDDYAALVNVIAGGPCP